MKINLTHLDLIFTTEDGEGLLSVDLPGALEIDLELPSTAPPEPEPGPEPEPEPPAVVGWIVAPDGTESGAGSLSSPWSYVYAWKGAGGMIQPGETVYLRGGTYPVTSDSDSDLSVSGEPGLPITFRSYPGEWAHLESQNRGISAIRFFGHDLIIRDLEFSNRDPLRIVPSADGPWGRADCVYFDSDRVLLANCVIHDGGNGCGFWHNCQDSEIYGCLIYNTGYVQDDLVNTWGHSFYVQNDPGSRKNIRDNVAIFPFRNGLDVYSATTAGGGGIKVEGNVLAHPGGAFKRPDEDPAVGFNGTFSPGDVASDFRFNENICFVSDARHSNWMMNGTDMPHVALECIGNQFIGGGNVTQWAHWDEARVTGNRFVGEYYLIHHQTAFPNDPSRIIFDENEYFYTYPEAPGNPIFFVRGSTQDFDGWREATGADLSSTFTYGPPRDLQIINRPNDYERGRGFVIVLNHSEATHTSVLLDDFGLQDGEPFEIIDAQNWPGGPITSGAFRAGAPITLPLNLTAVPRPLGYDHDAARDPRLNVFLCRRPLSSQVAPQGQR
jgi:hypothetical protein